MSNKPDSRALEEPRRTPPDVLEAMRELAEADKVEVARMSEPMFREHILPMLSAPAGARVDLTRWLEVAGTPLRAIDVVDDHTGETIFRVPALMRTIPTVAQQEVNFNTIVVESIAHENVHPAAADRYLFQQFSRVRTGHTLLDIPTARAWNDIRKRYDLPLIPIPAGDGTLETGTTPTASSGHGQLVVEDDQTDF
ncbi:hypothetical protein [Xanthomonas phage RTH11]|nr:hypothetical protein [Xanthomonas phage RTH11]